MTLNNKQIERLAWIWERVEELDREIALLTFERDVYKAALRNPEPVERIEPLNSVIIERCKQFYKENTELIENKIKVGSDFEAIKANFIKGVALGNIK